MQSPLLFGILTHKLQKATQPFLFFFIFFREEKISALLQESVWTPHIHIAHSQCSGAHSFVHAAPPFLSAMWSLLSVIANFFKISYRTQTWWFMQVSSKILSCRKDLKVKSKKTWPISERFANNSSKVIVKFVLCISTVIAQSLGQKNSYNELELCSLHHRTCNLLNKTQ